MGRLLRPGTRGLLLLLCSSATIAESSDRHAFTLAADLDYVNTSGLASWTNGSVGKLRYDDDSDGLVLGRAFVDYRGRISDTLNANVVLHATDDGLGPGIGLTEAFLEWRPVPVSTNRYRARVGAFYPRISLENTDAGWTSPYTLGSSAINTWIGEEVRALGAEISLSRRPLSLGGQHQFGVQAGAFYGNDGAGALLSWKGWSVHDRQSRYADELPLAPLPQIQPGGLFAAQAPYVTPFIEVDDRAGFYVNAEWRLGTRLLLRGGHYANRADPEVLQNRQYGWDTAFRHAGLQLSLPGNAGVIAQWLDGSSGMGAIVDGAHLVDVKFRSRFLLLTWAVEQHRLSLRYDRYDVSQHDNTFEDNNPENGHAWTVAYRYRLSDSISLATEGQSIKSHRCGWTYFGLEPTATETQVQLSLMFRFAG